MTQNFKIFWFVTNFHNQIHIWWKKKLKRHKKEDKKEETKTKIISGSGYQIHQQKYFDWSEDKKV
jgi:hypothetical protein